MLAAVVVTIAVLPASLVTRFLPPPLAARDLSGTLWHGSAGALLVQGREVGALEWHLHPMSLLGARVSATLHWVHHGFVAEAEFSDSKSRLTASGIEGGGPIEDLFDLGVPPQVRGTVLLHLAEVAGRLEGATLVPDALAGTVRLTDVTAVDGGAPLGDFVFEMPIPASQMPDAATDITAQVHDTGGPLGLEAQVRYAQSTRLCTVSGTLAPHGPLPREWQQAVDQLARLQPPDARGRVPLALELRL